jgi:hemin uptake protein HemP
MRNDTTAGVAPEITGRFGALPAAITEEMAPIWTTSRALFDDRQELFIEHASQVYRLRITRQNKLILSK